MPKAYFDFQQSLVNVVPKKPLEEIFALQNEDSKVIFGSRKNMMKIDANISSFVQT